jgi:hypothetical protein
MCILAVIAGYLGSLFTSFNTWVCIVRKRWGKRPWGRVAEVRWAGSLPLKPTRLCVGFGSPLYAHCM